MTIIKDVGKVAASRRPGRKAQAILQPPNPAALGGLTSLLWPPDSNREAVKLGSATIADLALDRIVQVLNVTGRHEWALKNTLCSLCTDPAVISYRQDVLEDLDRSPELAASLRATLPDLAALTRRGGPGWPGDSPVLAVASRLEELDRFVVCLDRVCAALGGASGLRSLGLLNLRNDLEKIASDPEVAALRAQLPELHALIGDARSVTIGVNLGPDLRPESATIVDLHREPFKGARSLVGRLLPIGTTDGYHGRTPLHQTGPASLRKEGRLYEDLQGLIEAAAAPLEQALKRFQEIKVGPLAGLEGELVFFTGAVGLLDRLRRAGLAVCRPAIAPRAERTFEVRDAANGTLALQTTEPGQGASADPPVVTSDVFQAAESRVLVLTGPNRGGKTTFCRAIGQAQVLFQAGLFVPGSSARISPVSGVWTHFPLSEVDQPGSGRLDDEMRRLRRMFDEADSDSLILMNEPLTSTSERDALTIARDLVRGLQLLGARVLLVTHLHQLAYIIPELNETGPKDCGVRSLVAGAVEADGVVRGTYKIAPGLPAGASHASEIARQHGLTFEQLRRRLTASRAADPSQPFE